MQLDSDSDQDCLSRDEKRGEYSYVSYQTITILPNGDASSNFMVLYGIGIALFYMVLHM